MKFLSSKNTFKLCIASAVGILLIALPGFAKTDAPLKTLKVVFFDMPPVSSVVDGKPEGVMVDLWEKVAHKAGVKIDWVGPLPFARGLVAVRDGEADAFLGSSKADDRSPFGEYSKIPIVKVKPALTILATDPLAEVKSFADIRGKVIGTSLGSALSPFLKDHEKELEFLHVTNDGSSDQLLLLLREKRIWGIYVPAVWPLIYLAGKNQHLDKIKLILMPDQNQTLNFYFLYAKKLSPEIRDKLEKALPAVLKESPVDISLFKSCQKLYGKDCERFRRSVAK